MTFQRIIVFVPLTLSGISGHSVIHSSAHLSISNFLARNIEIFVFLVSLGYKQV